jgi:hypothetical protein
VLLEASGSTRLVEAVVEKAVRAAEAAVASVRAEKGKKGVHFRNEVPGRGPTQPLERYTYLKGGE